MADYIRTHRKCGRASERASGRHTERRPSGTTGRERQYARSRDDWAHEASHRRRTRPVAAVFRLLRIARERHRHGMLRVLFRLLARHLGTLAGRIELGFVLGVAA